MARRPDSEAIASGECITPGCGQTMLVFRTKRRGHYLMGRCPDCKSIQGTGKAVQSALQGVVDGSGPPETVSNEPSEVVATTKPEPATAEDFDPGEPSDQAPEPTNQRQGRGGLVILLLATVGGIFAFSLRGK